MRPDRGIAPGGILSEPSDRSPIDADPNARHVGRTRSLVLTLQDRSYQTRRADEIWLSHCARRRETVVIVGAATEPHVRSDDIWSGFDQVYCLTLEGDLDRQRHASAELCAVGLRGFRFVEGVKADSDAVREAYGSGKVKSFPPCFRCGLVSCGSSECNNILIEPQVGCFLSFIKVFQIAAASKFETFLFFEDDVKFFDYTERLAAAALSREQLDSLGFFSGEPCLIGLGRGISAAESLSFDGAFSFVPRRKIPQNPGFAFNRAFAQLALSQFQRISHTSDVYIHFQVSDRARHYSLEPPLSYELSSSVGTLPSKIHPKRLGFENPANSAEMRADVKTAFDRHLKHVKRVPLVVLGIPCGGTEYIAHALQQYGLDVGHETIGADGISSWLFAVSDTNLPIGEGLYARNSRFVHADTIVGVVRAAPHAVYSTQIDNSKNIQSFAFRKRWIKTLCGVDVDAFRTDFEQALACYICWYNIIIARKPVAWIKLERAVPDLQRLFAGRIIERRREVDPTSLQGPVNDRESYFGQIYDPIAGDFSVDFNSADPFLKQGYYNLRDNLFTVFEDVI